MPIKEAARFTRAAARSDFMESTTFAVRPGYGLHCRGDADLRVRVYGVRVAFRGARPERSRPRLSGLRRRERAQTVLRLRGSRHRRATELRRVRRRLLRRQLWLPLA